MEKYAAGLGERATTSAAAATPAAVAAAQDASLVYQGHQLSRLLARRPTGQYTALLQSAAFPKKHAVNTEHEGAQEDGAKKTTPGRPFKGKRCVQMICCYQSVAWIENMHLWTCAQPGKPCAMIVLRGLLAVAV